MGITDEVFVIGARVALCPRKKPSAVLRPSAIWRMARNVSGDGLLGAWSDWNKRRFANDASYGKTITNRGPAGTAEGNAWEKRLSRNSPGLSVVLNCGDRLQFYEGRRERIRETPDCPRLKTPHTSLRSTNHARSPLDAWKRRAYPPRRPHK